MDISQWIGFFILLLAMIFSVIRKVYESIDRRRNPEKYREQEAEQERLLKELFGMLDEPPAEKKTQPPKVPGLKKRQQPSQATVLGRRPEDKFEFHSNLEDRRRDSSIESRQLGSRIGGETSQQLLSARFRGEMSEAASVKHHNTRAKNLVRNTHSLKDAFLLKEIFEPPVSLRNDPWTSQESSDGSENK